MSDKPKTKLYLQFEETQNAFIKLRREIDLALSKKLEKENPRFPSGPCAGVSWSFPLRPHVSVTLLCARFDHHGEPSVEVRDPTGCVQTVHISDLSWMHLEAIILGFGL